MLEQYRRPAGPAWILLLILSITIPAAFTSIPAFGIAEILSVHNPLPDFDSRTDLLAPTASQLVTVDQLAARATWNRFGTPQSLIGINGDLAGGYSLDPATAARDWLRDEADLFRTTPAGIDALELVNVSPIGGSETAAVLFRQSFGGLTAASGGLISVGVDAGQIVYASSSAVGDQAAPGAPVLSATDAWLLAAGHIGFSVAPIDLGAAQLDGDWTTFEVAGLSHLQRSRLRAFPTPSAGILPAFETIVLDLQGGHAEAYTIFVDAVTGDTLARFNRVQRFSDLVGSNAKAQDTMTFQGAYSDDPDPRACGPLHGPLAVPANAVRVVSTASAAIISNDIFIRIYHGSNLSSPVAVGDLGTSPEQAIYEPAGGVPSGDYFAEICPYDEPSAPPISPYTYVGTLSWEDTAVPEAFLVAGWNFFTANPPLDGTSIDTRTFACWTATDFSGQPIPGCELVLENLAARAPWDHNFQTGVSNFTTLGNAASTAVAWGSPLTPAEGYRPVAADRQYDYAWLDTWQQSQCSPTVFTPPGATQANDVDAAAANLFATHNRMHDWSYFLGFTERNYNMQLDNFGLTPPQQASDLEVGNVQAGAVTGGAPSYLGRDNANQITLNDGIPGITNMYLWQPIAAAFYPPCVDGDYDMGVIGHEYGHAISNRMAGGPDDGLSGAQAGAMGESWSDLMAMEYLNEYNLVPTGGESPYAVGTYATGSGEKGIRNYNMSRNLLPPSVLSHTAPLTHRNPLNFSNVGYDMTGAQVHADGEIWSATNFDLRAAWVAEYDAQYPSTDTDLQRRCADGLESLEHCPGNRRWMQIVFDAWLLMPSGVSMLDARDAYLAADRLRFGGANQDLLWRVFAQRGMGEGAISLGSDDAEPTPSFASPLENEATLRFVTVDRATGAPVEAEIFVGHFEARSTPIADTAGSTSLGDSADFVAGVTHDFLVRADGYGHVRFPYEVKTGFVNKTRTVRVKLAANVASVHQGASIAGDGINLEALIDDTEATNWASLVAPAPGDRVVVDLAGGQQRITRIAVSAMLRPEDPNNADSGGQNRFTALRQFEILTCIEGANLLNPTCSAGSAFGFTTIYTSPSDTFPAGAPRPLAPDLILRELDVPDTDATHVQLRVVHSQCTGTSVFRGEQDADPLNATDCATASSNGDIVRAAELQIFTTDPVTPNS